MIGRLHHVVLPSRDPRQTAQFWSRILGLPIVESTFDFVVVAANPKAPGLAFQRHAALELNGRGAEPARDEGRADAPVLQILVDDMVAAVDEVWRAGSHTIKGTTDIFADPDGNRFRLVQRRVSPPPEPRAWRRFVAIGDSLTEGMVDPDGTGGWIGWADRLAAHIATRQAAPLEYANLAVRSRRLSEIKREQFDAALAMEPDLLSIVGGMNDMISLRPDFAQLEADLEVMFSGARDRGITVITFTNPDISRANPLATVVRDRLLSFNAIVRRLAREHGVLFIDFEHVAMASDPRLWGEDRLHINTTGHVRVAAGMAWLLELAGFDRRWALDLDQQPGELDGGATEPLRGGARSHLDWARHHFGPWVVSGLRGRDYRQGSECKRPVPTVVEVKRQLAEVE